MLKKGSTLSTTSKFLIIPKGFFFSHLRSNLWINFCDKFIYIYFKKIFKIKTINLGLIFLLSIYYINNLLNIKFINFINFQKYYTKEERLDSIGNYYQMFNTSFKLYIKNNSKIAKNELYFNYNNLTDYFFFNLELKYYYTFLVKNSTLKNFEFFELIS